MRSIAIIASFVLLASFSALAQEGGDRPRRGRGGFSGARMVGPMLAVTADRNHDNTVTEKEWGSFADSLKAEDGLDADMLKRQVFVALLDANTNGKLEISDLSARFKAMDKDGDGALAGDEMGNRRRGGRRGGDRDRDRDRSLRTQDDEGQGGDRRRQPRRQRQGNTLERHQNTAFRSIVQTADKDQSRDVTAEEWKEFLESLDAKGGVIPEEKVASLMTGPEQPQEEGRRRRGGFGIGRMIDFGLGLRQGELTREKLDEIFAAIDANGDKKLDGDEMPRRADDKKSDKGKGKIL